MNRRGFLGALAGAIAAAPLVAKPTLEEIERLAWRRTIYPAWPRSNRLWSCEELTHECLRILVLNLENAHRVNRHFEQQFVRCAVVLEDARDIEQAGQLLAQTVNVRKPQRFLPLKPVRGGVSASVVVSDPASKVSLRGVQGYDLTSGRVLHRLDVWLVR